MVLFVLSGAHTPAWCPTIRHLFTRQALECNVTMPVVYQRSHVVQDAIAEQGWSDDNYAFHRTVFAPTTPKFIVDEQVCLRACMTCYVEVMYIIVRGLFGQLK
jgi:hypothetical protein